MRLDISKRSSVLARALAFLGLVAAMILVMTIVWAQPMPDILQPPLGSPERGWHAFSDVGFLLHATMTLILAIGLGTIIALHPHHAATMRSIEDIGAPRIYILYAFIGAIVGIMVIKFGLVVGFVLFGIGGLMRFRTVLRSASRTGRVIFVTLIGLACGLELPHVAVLATIVGFVLICVLDRTVTYQIDIRGIPKGKFTESAAAYHEVLAQLACDVMMERKDPAKSRIRFTFRRPSDVDHSKLVDHIETSIDEELSGSVNWRFE